MAHGGTEGTSPGVECTAPPAPVSKVGWKGPFWQHSIASGSVGWRGIFQCSGPSPSISPQVVPHPSKTHRDALAPAEKLCLILLDVKQVFNLHCFVPLFLSLAGTKHKALHPANFSAHQQLEKSRTGAQPCSSLFLPRKCKPPPNHILRKASPKYTRHGTVLLACRNCAKRALTYSNVTSQIPHQP